MENKQYQGFWWLPSNPDNKVAGCLTIIPQKSIELELIGSLTPDYGRATNPTKYPEYKIIVGIARGKTITLLPSKYSNYNISSSRIMPEQEKHNIEVVLIGYHFYDFDQLSFQEIDIQYDGLTNWVNNQKMNFFLPDNNQIKSSISYLVHYNQQDSIVAKITSGQISLIDDPQTNSRTNQVTLSMRSLLKLELESELHLEYVFSTYFVPLRNFLTLATTKINEISKVWLYLNNKDSKTKVEFITLENQQNQDDTFDPYKMLFTLDDIKDEFSLIMQRWFDLYQDIGSVLNLYFGVKNNSNLYLENKLLMLAQALEAYHRLTKRNRILSKEAHKTRIDSIIESCPEEHQEWLKQKLNFKGINEPSLHERLQELVDLHWLVMEPIVANKEQFIKDIKNSRNYYTHFNTSIKKKALEDEELFRLGQKLDFLLQACFLSELGCTPEKCEQLISRHTEYRYLQYIMKPKAM